MISKIEYDLLKKLNSGIRIDDGKFFNEVYNLRKDGYVTLQGNQYVLSGSWARAVEEYEHFLNNETRETQTLELAEDANKIAKKANQISLNANKKSSHANVISWIAIGVSILSVVASILCSIFFK